MELNGYQKTVIYGIGIDMVKIERMKGAVERWGDRFLRRVFTKNEIAYSYEKKEPFLSLSVRFAAKEAFIKAIGSEIPVALTDIEVMNYGSGRPFIKVKGGLGTFFEERSIRCVHLSLSHEREYGVACVVVEQ
jgi:holo-[acyl-carrier protein] synthase